MIEKVKTQNAKVKSEVFSRFSRKILILLVLFIIHYLLFIIPTYAASATPSAKKTSESSESSTLAGKLNALKEEIASKAAQIKQNVTKKIQNKAYFGVITDISGEAIYLETLSGKKTVITNEYTEYSSKLNTKKKIVLDALKDSDSIAALGDMDDKKNLVAKKIIILPKIATQSAKLIWGEIQSVSGSTIVLKDRDSQTRNIKTSFTTNFYLGNEEASLLDAKKGKFLVAKGNSQSTTILNADYIYYIPSLNYVKPEKKIVASPSANLKPSPSPQAKKKT